MSYTEKDALYALSTIKDPKTGRDIVAAGILGDLSYDEGYANAVLMIDPAMATQYEPVRAAAEAALAELPGVKRARIIMSAHKAAPKLGEGKRPSGARKGVPNHQARRAEGVQGDGKVGCVLAVSSAKGGVGKSTVAVNLAAALHKQGYKVGVLDADIHGPSMPRLMGLLGQRADADNSQGRAMIKPLENHGMKVMSVGFLTPDDGPIVWRGPMVQGMIAKMLWDVNWGELDYLILDMPPGTGDAQLGLAQDVKPKAAIIVTTPQDLALEDTRKGIGMFKKVDIPIAGIVENMSVFICPSCGEGHPIFGQGGAKAEAEKLDVPLLGAAPLDMAVRISGDSGEPIAQGESSAADIFADIARNAVTAINALD